MKACFFGDHENLGAKKIIFSTTLGILGIFASYSLFFQNSPTVSISLALQAGSAFLGADLCQGIINGMVKRVRSCSQKPIVQEGLASIVRMSSQEAIMLSLMQSMKYLFGEYDEKSLPEIFDDTTVFLLIMTVAFGSREILKSALLLNKQLGWNPKALSPKQNLILTVGPLTSESIVLISGGFIHEKALGKMATSFVMGGILNVGTKLLLTHYFPNGHPITVKDREKSLPSLREDAGENLLQPIGIELAPIPPKSPEGELESYSRF